MASLNDTWRLEAEMLSGSEVFRNHIDVKQVLSLGSLTPVLNGDAIVLAFQSWLVDMFYPDVTIQTITGRGIFYKQGPPPHPEHPPLWVRTVNAPGNANVTYGGAHNSNYLPASVCIYAKKATLGGRSGKMFLRNILTEVDVTSALAGQWQFSGGAGHFDPATMNASTTSVLGPYFTGAPATGNYAFAVTHLEAIADADPRTPFSSIISSMVAVRPVWNDATR
jgi:hypothetical protein